MKGSSVLIRTINLRHLLQRRLRTFLTVAGVAAGVALVFSISVMNTTLLTSFRATIREAAGRAQIEVASADQAGLPEATLARVAEVEDVEQAVPVVRVTSTLLGPAGAERALVLGVTPTFGALFPRGRAPTGDVDLAGGFGALGGGMVLGGPLADDLGVEPGDVVRAETPSGVERIRVAGVIRGEAVERLSGGNVAAMLLPDAQATFGKRDRIDSIYLVVDPKASIRSVASRVERLLGGGAVVGPPGERGRGLERIFASLGTLTSAAGTVSLFVALFVVYNTMSMALAERRRELSMSLALGATRRQLFAAFLGEAGVLGAVASVAGIALGWGLARVLVERALDAYRVLPVVAGGPVAVEPDQVALAALGGLAVSLAGAFVPARRVLEVAPVEGLRPDAAYEWRRGAGGAGAAARSVAGGLAGLALAVGLFFAYVLNAEHKWLVTASLVAGLSGITFLLPRVVPVGVRLVRPILAAAFGTVGRLAGDSLARNLARTTFTVAALVLTLGVAIGIGSALRSYEVQVERMASSLIGAPVYVSARTFSGITSDQPLPLSLGEAIRKVRGVRYVYPLRFSLVSLGEEQALLNAVPVQEALRRGASTQLETITDDPDAFTAGLDRGDVAVSRLTSERHGLEVGESVSLPTPQGRHALRVSAIYDDLTGFSSIYIDHGLYARLWRDAKADEFGVLLDDGAEVPEVKRRLQALVAATGAPARVYDKNELIEQILDIIEGTFALGRGIQLAALIVAALTIANTMFTAVFERRWAMALQRAVGMSGRQLGREVLLEACGIGAIGGAGGALLGTLTGALITKSMEVQFAWRIDFQAPIALNLLALGLGVAIAALSGLLPSRLAVRAPIIESLRYE